MNRISNQTYQIMLPTSRKSKRDLPGRVPDYVRRLFDHQQMDFEAAFDQILMLMSTDPKRAYTSSYYRKQMKNQWARDDPAFIVLQGGLVVIGSLFYVMIFENPNLWGYLWSIFYGIVIDWLLLGFIMSSLCSYVANKYLKAYHSHTAHTVEQSVEWLYAFDVHTNAFHVSFLVTYVLQAFLLPILLGDNIISCILSNTLYAVALVWYSYITYLGYTALPFLGQTQMFLWYPAMTIAGLWLLSVVLSMLGMHINLTRMIMNFHYS